MSSSVELVSYHTSGQDEPKKTENSANVGGVLCFVRNVMNSGWLLCLRLDHLLRSLGIVIHPSLRAEAVQFEMLVLTLFYARFFANIRWFLGSGIEVVSGANHHPAHFYVGLACADLETIVPNLLRHLSKDEVGAIVNHRQLILDFLVYLVKVVRHLNPGITRGVGGYGAEVLVLRCRRFVAVVERYLFSGSNG